jgi:hypothetical protein
VQKSCCFEFCFLAIGWMSGCGKMNFLKYPSRLWEHIFFLNYLYYSVSIIWIRKYSFIQNEYIRNYFFVWAEVVSCDRSVLPWHACVKFRSNPQSIQVNTTIRTAN